jgi:uncharacterized GH25 family protein
VKKTLCLILLLAANAAAHDLFIMPEQFRVAPKQTIAIFYHSGDGFPEGVQAPRRLQNAAVYSHHGTTELRNLREDGKRVIDSFVVNGTGHFITTVIAGAATIEMNPEEFTEYLKEEGLTQIIEARAKAGESGKPARERYTKFAKSIFLSGAPDEGFKRVVGLPIEFVPERDPYRMKSGESLPVRVLLRGKPAPNLEVRTAWAGASESKLQNLGRTDSNGRIQIPITSAGKWRLHAIHMERVSDPAVADWESLWATLTFEVR